MNTANKPIQEIIPGLFLGSCSAGFSLPLLEEHGISHIVALGDFEPLHQHITYKVQKKKNLAGICHPRYIYVWLTHCIEYTSFGSDRRKHYSVLSRNI